MDFFITLDMKSFKTGEFRHEEKSDADNFSIYPDFESGEATTKKKKLKEEKKF